MSLSKDVLFFADQLSNGVMIFSPECEVLYSNPAAQTMWNHGKHDVLEGFATGVGEKTISQYEHPVMQALQSNRSVSQTLLRQRASKQDALQWVKMTANPIRDAGQIKYVLLSLEDVTQSKQVSDILSSRSYMLDQLDVVDSITGLYNSRYAPVLLERTISDVVEQQNSLSVCVFDIDHFTRLNEAQGRRCGDEVLRYLAALLGQHMREGDVMARTGGGEFLVLLPSCSAKEALMRMEAFGAQLRSAELSCTVRPITVSGGIAEMAENEKGAQLVERADSLLYLAKLDGRDKFLTEDVV
ncbi:GGDEF domain-containing protein [Halodesulfovibrio marinisediminis]|uniref:diguanylate cyclase n=1 Tax=Halodesulfovibrio marinisediminis DSM 17456 TaxID=1121457 RepID=A0A1N6IWT9_9BACT|nr:sensor domain-containing diguanylate cyclase [Halodesulfovibrio marinisediminis]SIO36386.1 diguanylate cyclase (GGDEF) domain-containing protein [Halodesulfovibrio marinisediminis DSM 17456]